MSIRPDSDARASGGPERHDAQLSSPDSTLPRGAQDNTAGPADPHAAAAPWDRFQAVSLDPAHLARNRLISAGQEDPAYVAFDVLRTRLLQALKERGWTRVAITSPTKGCGKSFVAANLAFSLARRPSCRVVLMDMDLRIPSLATIFGIPKPGSMSEFLNGKRLADRHLLRIAPNLVVGFNDAPVVNASELLQEPRTADTLNSIRDTLAPDVVLYDLPPALVCDDLIAFLPQVDAVLLVVGGGITKANDVKKCERLLSGQTPLLGVVLNKAEDAKIEPYGYMKK
jgi:Mrp family chromosome partitioning ATPase